MKKNLFILRTNKFDCQAAEQYARLCGVGLGDVLICADERRGVVDAGGATKISMTESSIARLGLFPHHNAGWRCGDYFQFHAFDERSGYDFYWMIEPDVYFSFESPREFFERFQDSRADFLAAKLVPALPDWAGFAGMHAYSAMTVYRCLFPVTRVSARALEFLLSQRRLMTSQADRLPGALWPNDEGFVATCLMNGSSFACEDLNARGRQVYSEQSFRFGRPFLHNDIAAGPVRDLLFHPVLDRSDYLAVLRRRRAVKNIRISETQRQILQKYYDYDEYDDMLY